MTTGMPSRRDRVISTASLCGTATTIASTAWSLRRGDRALQGLENENSGRPTSETSYPWAWPASWTASAIMLGPWRARWAVIIPMRWDWFVASSRAAKLRR